MHSPRTGLGKQSRSIFMEMDANASKPPVNGSQPQTPTPRTPEVRKNIQVSPEWPPSQKRKVQKETHFHKIHKNRINFTHPSHLQLFNPPELVYF